MAAIDVGTNSVRLLVAEPGDPLVTVERLMQVTRLGAGVDRTGRLDDAALARTLDCIGAYADRSAELGSERLRITATSAVREACDRERFFAGVRARTGVDAEVLSGEDEARTAFRGATSSVQADPPFLVVDIGGGSTEFVCGNRAPDVVTSRPLGCVRLTERCLHSDPPTAAEVAAARDVVDVELEQVTALLASAGAAGTSTLVGVAGTPTLVGVAGTVTTLAALHLGLPRYEPHAIHGTRLPREAVSALVDRLAAMRSAERAQLGPMAPGREDVIVGGALILEAVLDRLGAREVLVSEADILDGLALGLLAAN